MHNFLLVHVERCDRLNVRAFEVGEEKLLAPEDEDDERGADLLNLEVNVEHVDAEQEKLLVQPDVGDVCVRRHARMPVGAPFVTPEQPLGQPPIGPAAEVLADQNRRLVQSHQVMLVSSVFRNFLPSQPSAHVATLRIT